MFTLFATSRPLPATLRCESCQQDAPTASGRLLRFSHRRLYQDEQALAGQRMRRDHHFACSWQCSNALLARELERRARRQR